MSNPKSTFALFFGNRGFFPASLIAGARKELPAALRKLGHKSLMLGADATRHGAVETPQEGEVYAEFLRQHRGQFDGVILSLPNFGDETGAVAALKDAGVPIFIQAYPDELDKMDPARRRDSFCGKFSIMDVFCQYGLPFTVLPPHTAAPQGKDFAANIAYFDSLCRVVGALRSMIVGVIGARTTAFKTVRIDELTLQRHGITVETMDLSDVVARFNSLPDGDARVRAKARAIRNIADCEAAPAEAVVRLAKLGTVLDAVSKEIGANALTVRCWPEMQKQLGVSPCVLLGEMNDRGTAAACETDVGSAIMMYALSQASHASATCLDWNNNYGDDRNKCILFHCGPVPRSLMTGPGRLTDHAILGNVIKPELTFGCNQGRIKPMPVTFGNMLTAQGQVRCYLGQGRITDDPIPPEFFGCAGVLKADNLQNCLQTIGYQGHRHHVAVTEGHVFAPVREAMEKYLSFKVTCV